LVDQISDRGDPVVVREHVLVPVLVRIDDLDAAWAKQDGAGTRTAMHVQGYVGLPKQQHRERDEPAHHQHRSCAQGRP
jgi:hypothetical protein